MRGKAREPRSLGEVRMEAGNHLGPPVVIQRMRLPWGVQRTDSGGSMKQDEWGEGENQVWTRGLWFG